MIRLVFRFIESLNSFVFCILYCCGFYNHSSISHVHTYKYTTVHGPCSNLDKNSGFFSAQHMLFGFCYTTLYMYVCLYISSCCWFLSISVLFGLFFPTLSEFALRLIIFLLAAAGRMPMTAAGFCRCQSCGHWSGFFVWQASVKKTPMRRLRTEKAFEK